MKQKCLMLFLVVIVISSCAPTVGAQPTSTSRFGIETDAIAYRIGEFPESYFVSGWYGRNHWKFGAFFTHLILVDEHTTDGFTDQKDNVVGVQAEYFFRDTLTGFSAGPVVMYVDGKARSKKNFQTGTYQHVSAGMTLGYTWRLWDHLTISPNLKVMGPIGKKEFEIGDDDTYEVPWNLEPGLRIGWEF